MSANSISTPYPIFTDIDGDPLKNGYVYIGTAGLDAETNPINVYWDTALTIPAAQPIRTINGYPSRNGSPGRLYCDGDYSIKTKNKNGSFIFSSLNATDKIDDSLITSVGAAKVKYTAGLSGAVERTALSKFGDVISVKDFGAMGDGITDDTDAIAAAAAAMTSGKTLFFPAGTYLISYQGTPYSSVYGTAVMDFDSLTDIRFIGDGAIIKVNNHDIATYGGLRFANFKSCKRVEISGFYFDMTFTGVNTSSSFYPFCGAITAVDDNGASPAFSTLNSDFKITHCDFKLYHPYGNWALSGNPYAGDPNNGYKLFSIFLSGPYTPSDEANQCRNVEVSHCRWLDGHNGYGFWVWVWNNVIFTNNIAESWVTKYSDQNGVYQGGGVALVRYIPFWAHGITLANNHFVAKKSVDRSAGFEGIAEFFLHANNQGAVSNGKGETIIANNTIILGAGYSSDLDIGIFHNCFGNLSIDANVFDGHDGQAVGGNQSIKYESGPTGGQGDGAVSITNNIFGRWLQSACIYFDNGVDSAEVDRRCKQLLVSGNVSLSGDFFLRMSAYSYNTYEGVRHALIENNIIDHTAVGVYPPPDGNNYGIWLAGNQATDVIICRNNMFVNKTYAVLSNTVVCNASADFRIYGNVLKSITTPYYTASQAFPGQQGARLGSKIWAEGDGTTDAQPEIGARVGPGGNSIYLYQQATSSYLIASNDIQAYTDGAVQTVTDSNVFRPGTDNAKTLGNASFRWSVVYAGTGTINTSDERSKQQIQPIDEKALAAWGNVQYVQYKFNDAVEEKGDGARWHFGLVAQRVKQAFEDQGLDAFSYGLLCYDEWEDQFTAILDEEGRPTGNVELIAKAGNRYGIRYEEALALECAYLRSKIGG